MRQDQYLKNPIRVYRVEGVKYGDFICTKATSSLRQYTCSICGNKITVGMNDTDFYRNIVKNRHIYRCVLSKSESKFNT